MSPSKETKFNNASIISPQSTKSLHLNDDNNSNHSTNTNVTTSSITTNASSPSHPNINRTFIKNSKLTPNTNTSRYNYVQNAQSQQQNNNNNSNGGNNNASSRPEQKCKENQNEAAKKKMLPFDNELVLQNLVCFIFRHVAIMRNVIYYVIYIIIIHRFEHKLSIYSAIII